MLLGIHYVFAYQDWYQSLLKIAIKYSLINNQPQCEPFIYHQLDDFIVSIYTL